MHRPSSARACATFPTGSASAAWAGSVASIRPPTPTARRLCSTSRRSVVRQQDPHRGAPGLGRLGTGDLVPRLPRGDPPHRLHDEHRREPAHADPQDDQHERPLPQRRRRDPIDLARDPRAKTSWKTCYNWTNAIAVLRIHFGDRISDCERAAIRVLLATREGAILPRTESDRTEGIDRQPPGTHPPAASPALNGRATRALRVFAPVN